MNESRLQNKVSELYFCYSERKNQSFTHTHTYIYVYNVYTYLRTRICVHTHIGTCTYRLEQTFVFDRDVYISREVMEYIIHRSKIKFKSHVKKPSDLDLLSTYKLELHSEI